MKILMPDKVSKTSSEMLKKAGLTAEQKPGIGIKECSDLAIGADALIVRSYDLHALELHDSIKAVGRAGAGVNNIPVSKFTEQGVVVFNTPGANANAVKELVLCGLFLSSRGVVEGVNWVVSLKGQGPQILKVVEENKSRFKGTEIRGKKLGVFLQANAMSRIHALSEQQTPSGMSNTPMNPVKMPMMYGTGQSK